MIGVLLHLGACALDAIFRAPQGSEVERLAAECDVLRGERDQARTLLADARSLAHEARLEYSAAREACEQLQAERATARQERDALQALVVAAVAARDRLEASDLEAEETGRVKSLAPVIEELEAWNALVEAVKP